MHRAVPEAISNPTESQIVLSEFDCGFLAANFEYALTNHGNDNSFSWENALRTQTYSVILASEELYPKYPSASDWLIAEKSNQDGEETVYQLIPTEAKLRVIDKRSGDWRLASFEEVNDFVNIGIDLAWELKSLEGTLAFHSVAGKDIPINKARSDD